MTTSVFFDGCLPFVAGMDVVAPAMILGEGLAAPGFDLRPGLCFICPERMIGRQSEWHKGQTGHVERAVIGVPVDKSR